MVALTTNGIAQNGHGHRDSNTYKVKCYHFIDETTVKSSS
jgi:hypothetical protein